MKMLKELCNSSFSNFEVLLKFIFFFHIYHPLMHSDKTFKGHHVYQHKLDCAVYHCFAVYSNFQSYTFYIVSSKHFYWVFSILVFENFQTGCSILDNVDEKYEFSRLKQSMEMVGFTAEKQRRLFSVLSAVLLIGTLRLAITEIMKFFYCYSWRELVNSLNNEVLIRSTFLLLFAVGKKTRT